MRTPPFTKKLIHNAVFLSLSAALGLGLLSISSASSSHSRLLPRSAKPQNLQPATSAKFFPVAVWYGGGKARAPMLEKLDAASAARWGKDLDQIRALGFKTVKCWVDWATAEPAPGKFDFRNLDLLMHLAQQRGLRVIIQIYLDSAPDWLGREYPDSHFVDRSGAVIPSESAPGFCFDHPGIRGEAVRFLQALAREANRSPALYGWDVWSEPHIVNWAEFPYLVHPEFCYCHYTQARFRSWLEKKYGSLAALDAAWYRQFSAWAQVEAPRASTILSYTDYLDWRAFVDDKLAGDLGARVAAIRSVDTIHPVTSHADAPGLFTSPTDGFGDPDDWKMAASADFFGASFYPKHAAASVPWPAEKLAAALDFERSSGESFGKGYWVGELQAGQGVTGMRVAEPVTSADLETWMWETVATGAREIALYAWYPMSSGYESGGYGLIHLDGSLTERARAAGDVARAIEREASRLNGSKPAPAEVAILYDRLSYMVGGSQPSLSKLGNATRDSLMGMHRAFWKENIPVDFVSAEEISAPKLAKYKILFAPFPVMMSRETATALEAYIRAGGTVVSEGRLAWNDARGQANQTIPGFDLDRVFGAREKMLRPSEKPLMFVQENSGVLPGLARDRAISGYAFEESLEPLADARLLAHFRDGAPAIIENSWGKGRAVLIGSFPSLASERAKDSSAAALFVSLAKAAGAQKEVDISGSGADEIEIRRLLSPNEEFVFAFNHGDAPASVQISISSPWNAVKGINIASRQSVSVRQEPHRAVFDEKIPPGSVQVVRISAQ